MKLQEENMVLFKYSESSSNYGTEQKTNKSIYPRIYFHMCKEIGVEEHI